MGQVFGVKLHQKSMRTSRIDRCEPRYAGTEFTNRDGVYICIYIGISHGAVCVDMFHKSTEKSSSIIKMEAVKVSNFIIKNFVVIMKSV